MFAKINQDKDYLGKSAIIRRALEEEIETSLRLFRKQGFSGYIQLFVLQNRTIFFVDEAEFAIFTGIGAVAGQLSTTLWIIAIAQVAFAFWRLFERGYQIMTDSPKLLRPMRK